MCPRHSHHVTRVARRGFPDAPGSSSCAHCTGYREKSRTDALPVVPPGTVPAGPDRTSTPAPLQRKSISAKRMEERTATGGLDE